MPYLLTTWSKAAGSATNPAPIEAAISFLLEALYEVGPEYIAGFLASVAINLCDRLVGYDSATSLKNPFGWGCVVASSVALIEVFTSVDIGLGVLLGCLLSALTVHVAWKQRLREARIYRATLRLNTPTDEAAKQQPVERIPSS